jgi:hypothetical protein
MGLVTFPKTSPLRFASVLRADKSGRCGLRPFQRAAKSHGGGMFRLRTSCYAQHDDGRDGVGYCEDGKNSLRVILERSEESCNCKGGIKHRYNEVKKVSPARFFTLF